MLYNPKNVYKKFDGPGTSDNSYIEDFLIFLTCFSVGHWPASGRPPPARKMKKLAGHGWPVFLKMTNEKSTLQQIL